MTAEATACPLSKGERILVAVDGSSNSDYAVDQALSMAATCNSKLFAITVVDIYPVYMEGAPGIKEKVEEEAKNILRRVKEKAKEANIACETILRVGHQPHEFITKEAKERNIDLIVMATHGHKPLVRYVVGSVMEWLIIDLCCPIVSIRPERMAERFPS